MNPYVLAVLAVLAWIVVATVVALAVGRAIRFRDRQVPRSADSTPARREDEDMITTTADPEAVTIPGYHVAALRECLARIDATEGDERRRATFELAGYVEVCLDTSGRPA